MDALKSSVIEQPTEHSTFFVSLTVFLCVYTIFWNDTRTTYLRDAEDTFAKLKPSVVAGKISELTFEQKMSHNKKTPQPPSTIPYDLTKMAYMSIEAVIKTYITIIVIFILLKGCNFLMGILGYTPNAQNATILNAARALTQSNRDIGNEPFDGLIITALFEFSPIAKALLASTLVTTAYSHALSAYRENQYNINAVRLHVTLLSFLHLVLFIGVLCFYSFSDRGIINRDV